MSQKIKQKGFISIPILITVIVSIVVASTATAGVVLHRQGKLTPLIVSAFQVFQKTEEVELEVKPEYPKIEQEQFLLEETNQEEDSQIQIVQELEQIKLQNEKVQAVAEKARQEAERVKVEAERLKDEQEAQELVKEKARQETQEIEQARQLELQRQLEVQSLAEEQRRLEEDVYQESEPLTYLELNKPYISKTGITITVINIEKVEEIGSYKYIISYKQENKTTDKELDQGTFKMFFEDGTGLNQYGFFNKLFPNESTTITYTFQILKTQKPFCIEFNDDINAGLEGAFFRNQPAIDTLKWYIINGE